MRSKFGEDSCPAQDEIRGFLLGEVDEAGAERISDHLEVCSTCNQVMSTFEGEQERVLEQMREQYRLQRLLREPELVELRRLTASDIAVTQQPQDGDPEAGRRIRDYRLLRKIGQGGMGSVYHAVHIHLGKSVALKMLPSDKWATTRAIDRFRREMRAAGSANHPNIVSASDAGMVDGRPFLVMELIEGVDLARVLEALGRVEVADACELVRQAALGLQHAHDNGFIHRDIKPSNLMLTIHGGVKVLDLGLAGLESTDAADSREAGGGDRLTSVGQLMGTLPYMAPEQMLAGGSVDGRADVYSLGATLFHLLTGRPPVTDGGTGEGALAEQTEPILHPSSATIMTLRGDVPAELALLLEGVLAKSPEDRPSTAAEVADKLSRFCAPADLPALAASMRAKIDFPVADAKATADASLGLPETASAHDVADGGRRPGGRWSRRWAALTAALIFLTAMLALAMRPPRGVVRVSFGTGVRPARVRIALEKDSQRAAIVDESGGWKVRVRPGQYRATLLAGGELLVLDPPTLQVRRGAAAKLQVRRVTDPSDLAKRGQLENAAATAERLAAAHPSSGWLHAQAAMMWAAVPLYPGQPSANLLKYERHRTWLARRWEQTGEGANTIPRICCLYPEPRADLKRMLKAVTDEMRQDPREWRYVHSQMMLLCRLEKYEEATTVFRECRRISPTNRTHAAVDHAWSAMARYGGGQLEEARKDHAQSLQLYRQLRPPGQQQLPEMWFDFIELSVVLDELETTWAPAEVDSD